MISASPLLWSQADDAQTLRWPATTQVPQVGVIMGSYSDWATMQHTHEQLCQFGVPHECLIVSAHRTPDRLTRYAQTAQQRGLALVIAGAGGAAHLPGMVAAHTLLPVLGVPITSQALQGVEALLSIVQMPAGVPVATLALGKAGAINAALLAVRCLAQHNADLAQQLATYQQRLADEALARPLISTQPLTPWETTP
jgi:5-(carboxyamino)imidazole ribonucleotide mutase